MGRVRIDQIEAGMVTSDVVRDGKGRVLLGAGMEITEKHLRMIKTWGVSALQIEGVNDVSDDVAAPEVTDDHVDAAEDTVAHLFKHAGQKNPLLRRLYKAAVARHAADLAKKE